MRRIALLGSTGSIGTSTLNVLRRHPDRFRPVALVAGRNAALLADQVRDWQPAFAGLVHGDGSAGFPAGPEALIAAATRDDVDVVVNAVVGAAGLEATLAALRAGKRVALANKETLVTAGALVAEAARLGGGSLVPIDSEHSAVLQCLAGPAAKGTAPTRLILTASGGPFRTWGDRAIAEATVDQALNHPTWSMGAKITVDSATLANKALEVIEAHFLFDLGYDAIEVVVHPQSIVHAFVEFADDNTFVDKEWSRELLRALEPLDLKWFTETDVSVADDDELLDLLARSGCRQLLIGLEAPTSEALRGLEAHCDFKARRADRYAEAVERIQSRGITVNGCFVLGLDGQGPEAFDAVLEFAERTGLYEVQITLQTAFPGTPLLARLEREGRVLDPGRWDLCTLFDVNFLPTHMSVQELRTGFYRLSESLYSSAAMKRRRARFFEQRRHAREDATLTPAGRRAPTPRAGSDRKERARRGA